MASGAEKEIRAAVVARLRELFPNGRIIHELNVSHGRHRADVACVTSEKIILVEIKSEKDVLKRLRDQVEYFEKSSHLTIVAIHQKFFKEVTYDNGRTVFLESDELEKSLERLSPTVWVYPKPDGDDFTYKYRAKWDCCGWHLYNHLPNARDFLNLLWKDELLAIAARHGLPSSSRLNVDNLVYSIWPSVKNPDIVAEVCATLRARDVADADPSIPLPSSGAAA